MCLLAVVAYINRSIEYFCCIEHARRWGVEPVRMLLPGEHISKVCYGCGLTLDTEENTCTQSE